MPFDPIKTSHLPNLPSSQLLSSQSEVCLTFTSDAFLRNHSPRPFLPRLSAHYIPILPPTTPPPAPKFAPRSLPATTLSPPAPHRRAPRPPLYKPRRRRSRHLKMSDPARSGLFPLCEEDEGDIEMSPVPSRRSSPTPSRHSDAFYNLPSSVASSDVFPSPSPRPELDVPVDVEMGDDGAVVTSTDRVDTSRMSDEGLNRLSWSTAGSGTTDLESTNLATPGREMEDPFSFDRPWETVEVEGTHCTMEVYRPVTTPAKDRSRRPPPLVLASPSSRAVTYCPGHPFAAPQPIDDEPTTPRLPTAPLPALSSPLPIVSPGAHQARRRPFASPTTPRSSTSPYAAWVAGRQSASPSPSSRSRRLPTYAYDDTITLTSALEDLISSSGAALIYDDFIFSNFEYERHYLSALPTLYSALDCDPSIFSNYEYERDSPYALPTPYSALDCDLFIISDYGYERDSPSARPTSFAAEPSESLTNGNVDVSAFPLPPARSPLLDPFRVSPSLVPLTTPTARSLSPSPPSRRRRVDNGEPIQLRGDHSFLQALSRGESPTPETRDESEVRSPKSPASSVGSSGSSSTGSGRLQKRKGLPDGWKAFGQPF